MDPSALKQNSYSPDLRRRSGCGGCIIIPIPLGCAVFIIVFAVAVMLLFT
jgi:hypothetical protein